MKRLNIKGLLTLLCLTSFIALIGLKCVLGVTIPLWLLFMPVYTPFVLCVAWLFISVSIGATYVYFKTKNRWN